MASASTSYPPCRTTDHSVPPPPGGRPHFGFFTDQTPGQRSKLVDVRLCVGGQVLCGVPCFENSTCSLDTPAARKLCWHPSPGWHCLPAPILYNWDSQTVAASLLIQTSLAMLSLVDFLITPFLAVIPKLTLFPRHCRADGLFWQLSGVACCYAVLGCVQRLGQSCCSRAVLASALWIFPFDAMTH